MSNFNDLPDMMTVTEVANLIRVTPLTLKRWEKLGRLIPGRIGPRRDRRYSKALLKAFLGVE